MPEYEKILHGRANNAIKDLIPLDGIDPRFGLAGLARQLRAAIGRSPASGANRATSVKLSGANG